MKRFVCLLFSLPLVPRPSSLAPPSDRLEEAIFQRMVTLKPPGRSPFSVEPAPCPRTQDPGPRTILTPRQAQQAIARGAVVPSSHYGGCVRMESRETGLGRYRGLARALRASLEGYPEGERLRKAALALGIGVNESGFREDVQTGRGRHGRPSDDGGEGRGPANEACVMQIHPKMGGGAELLGLDAAPSERCFARALVMLDDSERRCGQAFERIVSYYATGTYCNVSSEKVRIRAELSKRVYWALRGEFQ